MILHGKVKFGRTRVAGLSISESRVSNHVYEKLFALTP
jgi:hypothetical protein